MKETDSLFSLQNTNKYIREIAKNPRCIGTDNHRKIREYLINELKLLGLESQIQEKSVVRNNDKLVTASHVYNVLGKKRGHDSKMAILLVAHYDTQPNTNGAADNASGVAIILESLRVLNKINNAKNDIIVLFSDGEEYGLFGAEAFLDHPWLKDVGFMINLDARGNCGPSFLLEYNSYKNPYMELISKTSPYLVGFSFISDFYKWTPNDTDFSTLKKARIPGVNFAYINGYKHYHTKLDTPNNLDEVSTYHQGINTLAICKTFSNFDFSRRDTENDIVYFNVIGNYFFFAPLSLIRVIYFINVILTMLLIQRVKKYHPNLLRQLFRAVLFHIGILICVGGLMYTFKVFGFRILNLENVIFDNTNYYFIVLMLGLSILYYKAFRSLLMPNFSSTIILLGSNISISLFSVIFMMLSPSSCYFLIIPHFFLLIATSLILLNRFFEGENSLGRILLTLIILPSILFIFPVIYIVFIGLDVNSLPIVSVILGINLSFFLPAALYKSMLYKKNNGYRSAAYISFMLLCVFAVIVYSLKNKDVSPTFTAINYYQDCDTHDAFYATRDSTIFIKDLRKTDPILRFYPYDTRKYFYLKMGNFIGVPPCITVLQDKKQQDGRKMKLSISSERNAANLEILIKPVIKEEYLDVEIDGIPVRSKALKTPLGVFFYFRYFGLPDSKSIIVDLKFRSEDKIKIIVIDQSIGLPANDVKIPQLENLMPSKGIQNNLVNVRKEYEL